MTEVKDLDAKTLEYVLSMVHREYENTKAMHTYWKKEKDDLVSGMIAHVYGLQKHNLFRLTETIRNLIREQQESNDS